jgi:hypothetical protein
METTRIRDGKSRIRDKHPGSANTGYQFADLIVFRSQIRIKKEKLDLDPHLSKTF